MSIRNKLSSAQQSEIWLTSTIGNFGRWQFYVSFLMALLKLPLAWIQMSVVFLAPPIQFWCAQPPKLYKNVTESNWIEMSKPKDYNFNHESFYNGYCQMKDVINISNKTIPCVNGYAYNRTIFHSTIITEWNLVCGREKLVDISQIVLMVGILTGNIFFGILADKYGRKRALIIAIIIQTLFGLIVAGLPWFWGFVIARFFLAVANGGVMVASFVMCMEIVGGKWRTIVPILYQIPFGFGYSIMSLVAYFFRDWRNFQYALSGLSALFLVYVWIIPESPRWLLVKGKKKDAVKIIVKAAKQNGTKTDDFTILEYIEMSDASVDTETVGFSMLFSTKSMRKRTILLCLIWLLSGISFFTFTQYLGQVSGNLFFTTSVGGLVSIPGIFLCLYIVQKSGRRWTVAGSTLLTTVCYFLILFFPKGLYVYDWPRMTFAGIGLIGLSISMPALYLFTGELFPTVLRNAGVGLTAMMARTGAIIAPLVISLQETSPILPLVCLGIFGTIQSCLSVLLQETKNKPLPQLLSDIEPNENLLNGAPKEPNDNINK